MCLQGEMTFKLTLEEVGVVSIMDRQRRIEARAGTWSGGDILSCSIGADNKLEKPRGISSWGGISFIKSISIASSSSPFVREENFLKGFRSSADTEGTAELLVDTVDADAVVEGATGTNFSGETATLGLGGDKSRLSLRGAQLIGTLKLKSWKASVS